MVLSTQNHSITTSSRTRLKRLPLGLSAKSLVQTDPSGPIDLRRLISLGVFLNVHSRLQSTISPHSAGMFTKDTSRVVQELPEWPRSCHRLYFNSSSMGYDSPVRRLKLWNHLPHHLTHMVHCRSLLLDSADSLHAYTSRSLTDFARDQWL